MEIYKSPFWEAFYSRTDLEKYGVDALLLFALQLRFSIEDIDLVASTSLTEGGDDKKADLVYIDSETGYVIIAQTYIAVKVTGKNGELKKEAQSNKASDLNTAISWLLARPIGEVPENLRSHAEELRQALSDHKKGTVLVNHVLSGGLARRGETCDAVIGRERIEDAERYTKATEPAWEIIDRFKEELSKQFGSKEGLKSSLCKEIQKKIYGRSFKLTTEEGYQAFLDAGGHSDEGVPKYVP